METWKEISFAPGYFVSNCGRIKSKIKQVGKGPGNGTKSITDYNCDGKLLKAQLQRNGYLRVQVGRQRKIILVHRLVLTEFVGPGPAKMVCRHLDGNRTNNNISNLKWGTHSENQMDRHAHGTAAINEKNRSCKFSSTKINEIRILLKHGVRGSILSKIFGVPQGTISSIKHNKMRKYC